MLTTQRLITPKYLELQKKLHAGHKAYGENGDKWAGIVLQVAIGTESRSILDYGCGEGKLARAIRSVSPIPVSEYDPAIEGKDGLPAPADLVVVTDVLEHIEPDCLDEVLEHIRALANKAVFVVVATRESEHRLADGRGAHLIVKFGDWWKHKVKEAGFAVKNAPSVTRKVRRKEWAAVLIP